MSYTEVEYSSYSREAYHVPETVNLREYQKDAVKAWVQCGYRGIFSMCTGSGKSYTALACAVALAEKTNQQLAVFIVCPFIHLTGQWEEDVVDWAPKPIIAHSKSPDRNWKEALIKAYKRFRNNNTPFVVITSNDTFAGPDIQNIIKRLRPDQNVLLIIDEAHNFGAKRLSECLPENISYRIALSATIERHLDKVGTDKLYEYFGEKCLEYGLKEAIEQKVLVPYEYHPILVYLNPDELAEYKELTRKVMRHVIEKNGKTKITEEGQKLLFMRARLLAGAKAKLPMLMKLMEPYRDKANILVYCGATMIEDGDSGDLVRMVDETTRQIEEGLHMRAHRFTAEEDLIQRKQIKQFFVDGIYQVVTAIKCLDEGVNIPGIETAFIMASTKNPKEFIQRRGRLLRTSPGKKKAVIYDFITLPKDIHYVKMADYEGDRSQVVGEMARIKEFGDLSLNPLEAEKLNMDIMSAYQTYINIDEEMKAMEESYGVD